LKNERDELKNLVGQRIKTLREKSSPPPENPQRTGKQTLKILLADTPSSLETIKDKKESRIVLYLKDGLNPAKGNFTKYPNDMHDLFSEKLNVYETVAFIWIWRISWGFGKNYCRFGQRDLLNNTSIPSLRTSQRVIVGLREKKFIIAALDETGIREATNKGSLYRVCTPKEIIDGITEEGVSLELIPLEGIVCEAISRQGIAREAIASQEIDLIGDTPIARQAIPPEAIPGENPNELNDNNDPEKYRQRGYSLSGTPLKDKERIKDTLSQDEIISRFYEGIGHTKISKAKRERAEKDFQKLTSEGFSPEDIQFTVNWSLKNVKEKMYDFSIVCHTIGEAMAAKEKAEALQKQRADEENKALLEREEYEKAQEENQRLNSYKETMNTNDRTSLRERALAEIRKIPEINEDFISEMFINSKENEILKKDIGTVIKDSEDK